MLSVKSGSVSVSDVLSVDSLKLNSSTKLVPRKSVLVIVRILKRVSNTRLCCSDGPTKKGHLMLMTDANENIWERRWFVLRRCAAVFIMLVFHIVTFAK